MTTAQKVARQILARSRIIAAERERVEDLKQLAADTSEAYEQALAASGMTREHFRLRAMLMGLLPWPRKRE